MKIKKFDDYINEYGFNKDGEPYGFKDEDVFDITKLTSLQAKKLIDFLESDIEIEKFEIVKRQPGRPSTILKVDINQSKIEKYFNKSHI